MSGVLLVQGGTVITMDPARQVIAQGAVAIIGERIAAVGTTAELAAAYPDAQVMDVTGHAVLPGLIDGHAHAGHGLVKTLGNGNSAVWERGLPGHLHHRLAAFVLAGGGAAGGPRTADVRHHHRRVAARGGDDSVMRTDRPEHAVGACARCGRDRHSRRDGGGPDPAAAPAPLCRLGRAIGAATPWSASNSSWRRSRPSSRPATNRAA